MKHSFYSSIFRLLAALPSIALLATGATAAAAGVPALSALPGLFSAQPSSPVAAPQVLRVDPSRGGSKTTALVAGRDTLAEQRYVCTVASAGAGQGRCLGGLTMAFGIPSGRGRLQVDVVDPGRGGVSCAASGGTVRCGVSIPIGATSTVTLRLRPAPDARGSVTGSVTAVGNFQFDPVSNVMPIDAVADVRVEQNPSPTPLIAGATSPAQWTDLDVRNDGPSALLDAVMVEALPPDIDLEFVSPGPCTFDKHTLRCAWPSLAPGEGVTVRFGAALPAWYPTGWTYASAQFTSDLVTRSIAPSFYVVGTTLVAWQSLSTGDPKVSDDLVDTVTFANAIPGGGTSTPLSWVLTLNKPTGLRITRVEPADSGFLACSVSPDRLSVLCTGPRISSASEAGAKVHLRADAAGRQSMALTWTTRDVSGRWDAEIAVRPAAPTRSR